MEDPEKLVEQARSSTWGYIRFPRGTVLFMRLNSEQVVLLEPDGGYFYPYRESVRSTEMPNEEVLASALTVLPRIVLKKIAKFTSQPRTMQEIEQAFPDARAWHLRHLGFLADVGRRQRKIVSQWAGYDLLKFVR